MIGYDEAAAHAYIFSHLNKKAYPALEAQLPLLLERLIKAQLKYMEDCGALLPNGEMGEGDYDEDDAFESILENVQGAVREGEMDELAQLIQAFLALNDAYFETCGLLSVE